MLVRQLEDEVVKAKTHASQTNPEVKAHLEALQVENDHLSREIAILRETVKVKHFSLKSKMCSIQKNNHFWDSTNELEGKTNSLTKTLLLSTAHIYGWNFSRWIFFPKVVTFFETLAAVSEHFLQ